MIDKGHERVKKGKKDAFKIQMEVGVKQRGTVIIVFATLNRADEFQLFGDKSFAKAHQIGED